MLQLITILNRCHRFPGFVYQQARFSSDHQSIEIAVRPRKGSKAVCSRCHKPAPGYDQLTERRFVCSDMWEPYLKLIREHCSEALHILDRFHIVANMNKALDNVRADETSRMKREGCAPVLRKSRWLLLRRSESLGTDQHFRLRDLLRYNLKTVRAYLLKEAFQQLWEYNSPVWAGKFLDEWCRQTMRSRIEPMKKIARSLRNYRELIQNYFRAQELLSSGVVEA